MYLLRGIYKLTNFSNVSTYSYIYRYASNVFGEGEANDMNPDEKTMTENNEILDEGLDYIRDWRPQGPGPTRPKM